MSTKLISTLRFPAALLPLVEEVEDVDDELEEESFDDVDEEEDSFHDDDDDSLLFAGVDESPLFAEPFAPARLSVR